MNCLAHIVKYILYIFNLIFVICGILLIVFGSIMINNIGDLSSIKDVYNPNTIPILIVILGCIVFLVAFFGCCGAIRESICCTTVYAVFMFILLILQIVLVSWVFANRKDFINAMGEAVEEAWKQNDQANGYPMDALQIGMNCCGLNSYKDYVDADKTVPKSCCGPSGEECDEAIYISKLGCRQQFINFWSSNTNVIRFAGIGVALVELVAFVFATCLACSIRQSDQRM